MNLMSPNRSTPKAVTTLAAEAKDGRMPGPPHAGDPTPTVFVALQRSEGQDPDHG